MFGAVEAGQEEAVRFFEAWKAQVVKEVPAERLLVWQVKQGWGPLCEVAIIIHQPSAINHLPPAISHQPPASLVFTQISLQFLGVPVPEQPFPNMNDTPSMLKRIR
jgi:hypothetical protein